MAMQFSLEEWERFDNDGDNPIASVSLPHQIFCWSRTPKGSDAAGKYMYGDPSGLRTMIPDTSVLVGQDLNEGFPQCYVKKDDPDDAVPVDVIVFGAGVGQAPVDGATTVVTFRNNLNKLCMTPIARNDPWVIDGTCVNGTLFLQIVKQPEARPHNDESDKFTYYGYKFESLATGSLEPDSVVDTTGEFAVMMRVRLGRHRVLMAAEVDAFEPPPAGLEGEDADAYVGYVELKTFAAPMNDRAAERLYRDKYPRWWVQSYLAGVPTLVAGARDRGGKILKVERHQVTRLPAAAAAAGYPFDAARLLRFADCALAWMYGVAAGQEGEHVRFSYVPGRKAVLAETVEGGDLGPRVQAVLEEAAGAAAAAAEQGQGGGEEEGGGLEGEGDLGYE